MLLKMTFHQSFFRLDARLTFPQARLRQSQPRLQEYWFFVLGAIFNLSNFYCSSLHFDSRLKTCRRGWYFDNLACRKIDFSFWAHSLIQNFPSSFVDLSFQRNIEWKHSLQFVAFLPLSKRKLQPKRFAPQIWRKNFSSTSSSEEGRA